MNRARDIAYEYAKEKGIIGLDYNQIFDAVVFGYEQAEKERNLIERQSPITGGKMLLKTEMKEVTFRNRQVRFPYKYYHCVDLGEEFTDTELDDDNMWAIFRAYCEDRGFEYFSDIVFRKDLELTQKDIGCILEIWLMLNREESYRNMSRDEICKVVLEKYKETIK